MPFSRITHGCQHTTVGSATHHLTVLELTEKKRSGWGGCCLDLPRSSQNLFVPRSFDYAGCICGRGGLRAAAF